MVGVARQNPEGVTDNDINLRKMLATAILINLFGPAPVLKTERERTRVIAELSALDPELFDNFINFNLKSLSNR